MEANQHCRILSLCAIILLLPANSTFAQPLLPTLLPEQRTVNVRDPSQLAKYRIRDSVPPPTVSSKVDLKQVPVSLDDIVRMALERTDVVRILAGATAVSSGQTIYDAAITNSTIDQNNAIFDPTLSINNTWSRINAPSTIFDPVDPSRALIFGNGSNNFINSTTLTKQNALGGTAGVAWNSTSSSFAPGISPLNPQTTSSANINYTQPLLKGMGIGPNMAPIVISRINTELSFFQLKDSVQDLVRSVISEYWSLVASRTDVWSKKQQIEQLEEVVNRVKQRVKIGIDNRANLSQVQVTLANARANLVSSRAAMIQQEGVLRNLIGLPPSDESQLIPYTPPTDERFQPDWSRILEIASERRPDLIELKLIIEADEQQLILARNGALPQLDGVAVYRWNGLDGTMPNGSGIRSGQGAFNDWTLGVNFSVPLGLRQARAQLRQRELILARDRINLQQGFHNSVHILATSLRSLDQAYEQYLAYREVREAAKTNLDYQLALLRAETGLLINVLQAVSDWGNAISNEASALSTYNSTLAILERQTGTILETHGVTFYEERFGSIGPLGRFVNDVCYPSTTRPTTNEDRYGSSDKPAEEVFELERVVDPNKKPPPLDYDRIRLPTMEESLPAVPPSPTRAMPKQSPLREAPEESTDELNGSRNELPVSTSNVQSASTKPKSWMQKVYGRFSK